VQRQCTRGTYFVASPVCRIVRTSGQKKSAGDKITGAKNVLEYFAVTCDGEGMEDQQALGRAEPS
jgi:hypothetical protein